MKNIFHESQKTSEKRISNHFFTIFFTFQILPFKVKKKLKLRTVEISNSLEIFDYHASPLCLQNENPCKLEEK